ncbi:MAG: protein-(glutamine-N5) methyltransferase, release factor-specific [Elusimicrobia bacterium RIFCSPLOWO2_01_FULL_60_11]|nr:MAG: protein-(glutamine-N5) methyltransferase, release factor-specific [Elusimicrobia bacterium RIFCSPLOWO2_01_FULL_60_11]
MIIDNKRLTWGEKELSAKGVPNPLMESLWLLRAFGDETGKFEAAVKERGGGKPLAYILGTQEFEGHVFKVNESVLIPRQETMVLVQESLQLLRKMPRPLRVLDLGTGSGSVAVCLASEDPTAQVYASDLSETALSLARENASLNGVGGRITFFKSDLLDSAPVKFDMIVSNPPYIKTDDIPRLQKELRHEPFMALDGGTDGMLLITKLARTALTILNPRGFLVMEVGYNMSPAVSALLTELGYAGVRSSKDDAGMGRVVIGQVT